MSAETTKTILQVDGRDVTITQKDADAIKAALVDHLAQSNDEDRDVLLRKTQGAPAWIDPDGFVRIGAWLLGAKGAFPALRFREPPTALGTKAHLAILEQDRRTDGSWRVKELLTERIRPVR